MIVELPWDDATGEVLDYTKVRVKVKILDGEVVAASPEYDDRARLAAEHDVPLGEVVESARRAAE
jgi:uncharacterized protein (DUF111 family)